MEIWKAIPGFEGIYEASSYGRIRSLNRIKLDTIGRHQPCPSKIIKPLAAKSGYLKVNQGLGMLMAMYHGFWFQ